jgi:hypothetical protein
MDSHTYTAQTTIADLVLYKAVLAPKSPIPIPHLGIRDPETGNQLYEFMVTPPLANMDQLREIKELAEKIRQEGEYWLERREKEWMEQLREHFGIVPPS